MPKYMVWFLGWRPEHTYPSVHTIGQKQCFWIPEMVVFERHHAKRYGVGSGVAPQTRITVHTVGLERSF